MSIYLNDSKMPFKYTNAAIIPINTVIFDFDTQEIESPGLALQVSALGTTGVLIPEFSSDEVNWFSGWCEPSTISAANQSTITAVGLYLVPKLSRFVRLRMSTATTAGTTTISMTKTYADFRTITASAGTSVVGASTHDSPIGGNPIRVGGRAAAVNYAAVSTGDVADYVTTLVGAQITKPFSIPEADWSYAAAAGGIIVATDVVARAAAAAGIRNYITAIQLRNTNAVATEFVIKEGATVIWRTQLPAAMTGSMEVEFLSPLKGAVATAINIQCVTTGAAVYANLQGYQAP